MITVAAINWALVCEYRFFIKFIQLLNTIIYRSFVSAFIIFQAGIGHSQTITGVWSGKIRSTRLELKLVKTGDSLVGSSYYYDSKNNFRHYSIKGYFDPGTNNVIWWDDVLIEEKNGKGLIHDELLSVADFNCPGEGKMLLDGNSTLRDDKEISKGPVHLQKVPSTIFPDEWDYVIENYTVGGNDPYLIDSISTIAGKSIPAEIEPGVIVRTARVESQPVQVNKNPDVGEEVISIVEPRKITSPQSVEQKFTTRKKILATVIPLTADSLELRFYDNAEIDGDSIAVFLNNKMIVQHIRLLDQPYIVKFSVNELPEDNELVMVAENLGSIPPNTSLMVAVIGDKRYETRIQSTETSSALIRFIKQR